MRCGDTIKMKYNGMKQKFMILHPTNIITEDCIQQVVIELDRYIPLCYDEVVSKIDTAVSWYKTTCAGDMVCDEHLHRVYLKPVSW